MLTAQEQQKIRDWVKAQYPNAPEDFRRLCEIQFAAFQVIGLTLGTEWTDRVIKPSEKKSAKDDRFLRRAISSNDESVDYTHRVIRLAEYLTQLSSVTNFDAKIEDLRRKGLEETFYELRVANSLHKWNRLVKFVVPSNIKGEDFDLQAQLNNTLLAVEVKCVTDEPDYTARKLYNRLKKAASQLPSQGCGAIFVMLPPSWTSVDAFVPETRRAVESVFRNYSRLNAAFFHWEERTSGPPYGRHLRITCAVNEKPKARVADINNLIGPTALPSIGTQQFIDVSYI